ncbi:MAG: hypothetical protein ACI4Q3_02050 [Kiritimatiellia bacterium]
MMFAAVPVIAVPIWIVVGCVSAIFAYMAAHKWLKKDSHRDMIIFMGPKGQGKTELKSALLKQGFNENRQGTGVRVYNEKYSIDEDDIGCKKIVALDSGGEETHIRDYVNKAVEYIDEKRPDYVLIVLVLKRDFLQGDIVSVSDKVGEYLYYITEAFDKNDCKSMQKRYQDGWWTYVIATTHCDRPTNDEKQKIAQIEERIDEKRYRGLLGHFVDRKLNGYFELSRSEFRKQAIIWIVKILKLMHKE